MGSHSRIVGVTVALTCCAAMLPIQPAFAGGDGTIVIQRTVQPRIATRPTMVPDANPITVNPNISPQVSATMATTELDDGEFAQITTGSSLTQQILPGGNLPGMNNTAGNMQSMPGVSGGSLPGASGSSISNQVNGAVKQGLAPLQILTGGR